MSNPRTRIFVTRRLPESIETRMAALFDAEINAGDTPLGSDELVARLADKQVLVSTITDRIDADLIARLPPGLRLIAQFGNGFDNIDLEAAWAAGLTVTNTPSVLTEDTADMAMALILALPRRLVEGARLILDERGWPGWSPTAMLGHRMRGKSLGIVGMGRIGTAVAQRARAFGFAIHYHSRQRRSPQVEAPLEATFWASIDDMLGAVDIVSLHTPLTRETHHLLSAERLAALRSGAYVVNVSRPELIDEPALVAGIEAGRIAGAALDVFEHRNGIDPRLLRLAKADRVLLTGHMASATLEARIEMGEAVIVNIRTFLDGHQPPHRVLPERGGAPLSAAKQG
jgi:glyoxylate reductase